MLIPCYKNMKRYIEPLKSDDSSRTMFEASVANELIDVLNAFLQMKVIGGTVTFSDANVVIQMNSGSLGHGGGGGTTTNINSYGGDTWL